MILLVEVKGNKFFYEYLRNIKCQDYVTAFPIGGGMQCKIPKKYIKAYDVSIPKEVKKIKVGFNGLNASFPAYIYEHDRWNGWMCPYMIRKVAERFLEKFIDNQEEWQFIDDTLVSGDGSIIEEEMIEFKGKLITVYNMSMGLCWTKI